MYHEDVRNLCGMGGEGEGEGKAGEGVLYKTKWVVVGKGEANQQGRSEKRCRDFCLATDEVPPG
jgi:hypothetical protein